MLVKEFYELLDTEKKGMYDTWTMQIYDMSGNVCLGYCNPAEPYEDILDAVKSMEVKKIRLGYDTATLKVELDAEYLSQEECLAEGYQVTYKKPNAVCELYHKFDEKNNVRFAVVDTLAHLRRLN